MDTMFISILRAYSYFAVFEGFVSSPEMCIPRLARFLQLKNDVRRPEAESGKLLPGGVPKPKSLSESVSQ